MESLKLYSTEQLNSVKTIQRGIFYLDLLASLKSNGKTRMLIEGEGTPEELKLEYPDETHEKVIRGIVWGAVRQLQLDGETIFATGVVFDARGLHEST